ncbi:MAG: asparagine synthase (glutamine-hydrolyzing) [Bacteroidetes bacterium]|nr:asparagine synthase (glutamine-hydrolyzing) [Bacteroidota bacterium]
MCGIAGVIAKTEKGKSYLSKINIATECLAHRGPDGQGIFSDEQIALGHRRLSIIDTSTSGNQPMYDATKRYVVVFNGEFFNYKHYRNQLLQEGVTFNNESDTEVLLQLYIKHGIDFLHHVNGFFALALYDTLTKKLVLARDRFGVKPMYIYEDEDVLLFASELKSILTFGINKTLNYTALLEYLQLNYINAPLTIIKNVHKMPAACYSIYQCNKDVVDIICKEKRFYQIQHTVAQYYQDYESAKKKLNNLMHDAVQRRLVADVPLGAFLSGGIDSSIICALASKSVSKLNTFSIGYADEKYFDETVYANLVAKKLNTNHTVFSLRNDDLFNNLFDVLDSIDEPFADSSAIAVYILSKETRKHVTVALSGDGADEIFAGYNKHAAELKIQLSNITNLVMGVAKPVLNVLPKSRNNKITNTFRQLHRYAEGAALSTSERYYRWISYAVLQQASSILKENKTADFIAHQQLLMSALNDYIDFNSVLLADVNIVLQGDMLVKVDTMSMANSLEVRNPFLDYTIVDFAFKCPPGFKIDAHSRKKILKDTFRNDLPEEIFKRGKHGFEVPLLKWLRNDLNQLIREDLLSKKTVEMQGIFNYHEIEKLIAQLHSTDPGEAAARIWGLIVFQYWWKKNIV